MLSFFDIILIILLSSFLTFGLFFGLIHTFGALVGVIFGSWVAGHYFLSIAGWISSITGFSHNAVNVIVFILLFILVNRLIALIFSLLDKLFDIIAIIPFLKSINKLAGAVLGLVQGALVLGLSLYILSKYSVGAWIEAPLKASVIAPKLIKVAKILLPFIPTAIKAIKGVF
ncbi:CvpA family protein [Patescibacteria group bacterium]